MSEKVKPVELINPAAHSFWRPRLEHLIDYHPRMMEDLFRKNMLEQKLADDVNAALTEVCQLKADGMEEREAKDLVFETMIAPNPPDEEPKPIATLLLKRIMRWTQKVEDRDQNIAPSPPKTTSSTTMTR